MITRHWRRVLSTLPAMRRSLWKGTLRGAESADNSEARRFAAEGPLDCFGHRRDNRHRCPRRMVGPRHRGVVGARVRGACRRLFPQSAVASRRLLTEAALRFGLRDDTFERKGKGHRLVGDALRLIRIVTPSEGTDHAVIHCSVLCTASSTDGKPMSFSVS
jgi:hypothetical protein